MTEPRPTKEFIIEYASRIREVPNLQMWVMLPGGIVTGRPGYVTEHFHYQFQALSEEELAEAPNEKTAYLAFEDTKCYIGSGVYHAGMILIDPTQVSAWGIYNPDKHTFEKA